MLNDIIYAVVMVALLIASIAIQNSVRRKFKKYATISPSSGLTGAEAAKLIMASQGVSDVYVGTHNEGDSLTNYYDTQNRSIFLSNAVANGASVSAVGIACHEAGHAIQYNKKYFPVKIRNFFIPITMFSSKVSVPLIVLGFVLSFFVKYTIYVAYIGVILYAFAVLFQLLTLPVEFNASKRALQLIKETNILSDDEIKGAKDVLTAAAMTYVAALAVSSIELFRLISVITRRN